MSQCRICIGVAAVMLPNGDVKRQKLKKFSYTWKILVSLMEWDVLKKRDSQIMHLKSGTEVKVGEGGLTDRCWILGER